MPAIADKYIVTPHGVFDMKFFLSHVVKTESGDDLNNTSVKNTTPDLIKTEAKHKPLSDDKLAKLLHGQGIKVAKAHRHELPRGAGDSAEPFAEIVFLSRDKTNRQPG